jgi:hypothetical protein
VVYVNRSESHRSTKKSLHDIAAFVWASISALDSSCLEDFRCVVMQLGGCAIYRVIHFESNGVVCGWKIRFQFVEMVLSY